MQKNIIYEDDDIIAAYKPAGIATQTKRLGQQDMVSELKNYLAKKPEYKGKGEPYLGLIHRLDQPVSGILVFAKNKNAAAKLSRQVTDGVMKKYYYAVILGSPTEKEGRLENYLYKDGKTNQSLIVKEGFPEAKKAVLTYRILTTLAVLEENGALRKQLMSAGSREVSLAEIQLITGRHHQIRAQFSYAGYPLLGDGKYGSEQSKLLSRQAGCRNTALCAYKLVVIHPVSQKEMIFERQPEDEIFLPFFTKGI